MSALVSSFVNAISDPYFSSVTGLWHFDNAFTNNGSGAAMTNFSINPGTLSSTQSKFGGFSFNMSAANQGCFANGSGFSFGTGDYTIEFWVYLAGVTTAQNLIDFRTNTSGNQPCPTIYVTGGTVRYFNANADRITSGAAAISVNTWTNIALARLASSTTSKLFVNGTQVGSSYTSDTHNSAGALCTVPSANGTNGIVSGYVDEVRVTKGVCRYTSNFTPATAAFPNS